MTRAVSAFMEFCYLVCRSVITDDTLTQIDNALARYHKHREVFRLTGVRPQGFSSLPRQHSIIHYPSHVRNFGAPNGVCSSITESKHIKAVKDAWRKSNRHQPLGQMLLYNQRIDKLAAARVNFTARGMMHGTCLSEATKAFLSQSLDCPDADHHSDDGTDIEGDHSGNPDDMVYAANEEAAEEDGDSSDDDDDGDEELQGIVEGPRVLADVVLARKHGKHCNIFCLHS